MRNKILILLLALVVLSLTAPTARTASPQHKVFTGKVVSVNNYQMKFMTGTGAAYTAEISRATLLRKYGAPMQASEILVGDKVEVKGALWPDNSMNATAVRNMSLYAHSGTFSGKVTTLDPAAASFVMQTGQNFRTVRTDSYTIIKKNGAPASVSALTPGMSVKVKGQWERSDSVVAAKSVEATVRLINITITGRLVMKSPTAISIVGDNNAIYGAEISKAKLTGKNNKPLG